MRGHATARRTVEVETPYAYVCIEMTAKVLCYNLRATHSSPAEQGIELQSVRATVTTILASIGSKTVVEYTDLKVISAILRLWGADLEDMQEWEIEDEPGPDPDDQRDALLDRRSE